MSDLTIQEVVRDGPQAVYRGLVGEQPVIIKHSKPVLPWLHPQSAFYGGQGLVAPFVPLLAHEAAAWQRVDPDRLVWCRATEQDTWLVLRAHPGGPLEQGVGSPRTVLVGLLQTLAHLHASNVLHRDIRPANVLAHNQSITLIDLDVACIAGAGPAGLVGSRAWVAPETLSQPANARSDLYSLGQVVRWHSGDQLPSELRSVLDALTDTLPDNRPSSACEVLNALGENPAPPPQLSNPHPALWAWWQTSWADALLAAGDPWQVIRTADRAGLGRWQWGTVAGRLLAAAPTLGTDTWLALAAACWRLGDEAQAELHQAQALEAQQLAQAPWHPAAQAVAQLASHSPSRQTVLARCALGLARSALEESRSIQDASGAALAAWHLSDPKLLDANLRRLQAGDSLAVQVAASRLLREAPHQTPPHMASEALPEVQLEAVRELLAHGNRDHAQALIAAYPAPTRSRAQLIVHLFDGDLSAARGTATGLATDAHWDPVVAATLLTTEPADANDPLIAQALRIVAKTQAGPALDAPAHLVAAIGARPEQSLSWALGLPMVAKAHGLPAAVQTVGLAGTAHGALPWRVLVGNLLLMSHVDGVRAVLAHARSLFPNDVPLLLIDVCVHLLQHNTATTGEWLDKALQGAPKHDPLTHLLWALYHHQQYNPEQAQASLRLAQVFNAPANLVNLVRQVLASPVP